MAAVRPKSGRFAAGLVSLVGGNAKRRFLCGQNAAGLCSFRPIVMGKHEKADFLRPKSGQGYLCAIWRVVSFISRFSADGIPTSWLLRETWSLLILKKVFYEFFGSQ
jgi:hypothetical protein